MKTKEYQEAFQSKAAAVQDCVASLYNLGNKFGGEESPSPWNTITPDLFEIGEALEIGEIVPQDYVLAAKCLRMAAVQGHVYAQAKLGSLYAEGKGVPRDYVEAYKWHDLAAAELGEQLLGTFEQLVTKMTEEEVNEAKRRSTDFAACIAYQKSVAFLNTSEAALPEAAPEPSENEYSDDKKDVTHFIERLEALEDRLGIRFEALYASYTSAFDAKTTTIWISGECHWNPRVCT